MTIETDKDIKKKLPAGEWQDEPDYQHWVDEKTGLDCLIVRQPDSGHLCGYVGVPKGHALFGKDYDSLDFEVHGGLTYANECHGRICHKTDNGDHVWWLGFDCAHSGDISPGYERLFRLSAGYESYKNVSYVMHECKNLAQQISEQNKV